MLQGTGDVSQPGYEVGGIRRDKVHEAKYSIAVQDMTGGRHVVRGGHYRASARPVGAYVGVGVYPFTVGHLKCPAGSVRND